MKLATKFIFDSENSQENMSQLQYDQQAASPCIKVMSRRLMSRDTVTSAAPVNTTLTEQL